MKKRALKHISKEPKKWGVHLTVERLEKRNEELSIKLCDANNENIHLKDAEKKRQEDKKGHLEIFAQTREGDYDFSDLTRELTKAGFRFSYWHD